MSEVLIVGQGLAGTVLAWELERAGIACVIADAGHEQAASRVAAGVLNPVTGQRIVKSWRVDILLPIAREAYRAMEKELGLPLWRDVRVRRLYLDDRERTVLAEKQAKGVLGDYIGGADEEGFWIEGAGSLDLPALLIAARARWKAAGVLREERVDFAKALNEFELVIDCTGASGGPFGFVPWAFSKGQILHLDLQASLEPDVVLNRGYWLLPMGERRAKAGATHEPARTDLAPTPDARAELAKGVSDMNLGDYTITAHEAGVRSYLADKRPAVGRHPGNPRLGVLNGLGAKGTLFAPALAQQWVRHLVEGMRFEAEVDVARYWKGQTGLRRPQ